MTMKRITLFAALILAFGLQAQEYLIVTTVESIVPAGLGRSRMIVQYSQVNVDDSTTSRNDGKTSEQREVKRSDARGENFDETKLLNFQSLAGINFQNIASNDALITDRLNNLAEVGWILKLVTSAVESDAGKDDGEGIFITRFILCRE